MTTPIGKPTWHDAWNLNNEPQNWRYSIEPHGDGYALYYGRSATHHGANLAHLTEISQKTINAIVDALNKTLEK